MNSSCTLVWSAFKSLYRVLCTHGAIVKNKSVLVACLGWGWGRGLL